MEIDRKKRVALMLPIIIFLLLVSVSYALDLPAYVKVLQAIKPPVITIHSPEPKNYSMEKLWLKVTVNQPVDNWWYKLNSGTNKSFTPNITIDVARCGNNLTVYANSSGNVGFSSVKFNALRGDVDGDKDVDIFDIIKCASAFGSKKGNPRFKPVCDIVPSPDGDGVINIFDITAITGNYGRKC